MAKIIDGKAVAKQIRADVKKKVKKLKSKPGLAVVLVGKNPASHIYVSMKKKACKEAGIYSEKYELDENTPEDKLLKLIDDLNQNKKIHGILVQLPLPGHINEQFIIDSILPHKDVDGFSPLSMGNLFIGKNMLVPATPKGILKLIESTGIKIEGKHAVVVGRSNIVGKPISILLQQRNATVTMCHSKSKPLEHYTKQADILVVAAGKPKMITAKHIKKGAIVIDVGTHKIDGKICGDVDFDSVKPLASYITPSPGGVGPMTIACLLENTLECYDLGNKFF